MPSRDASIIDELEKVRHNHYQCISDAYWSCPASYSAAPCNCYADEKNAIITRAQELLRSYQSNAVRRWERGLM